MSERSARSINEAIDISLDNKQGNLEVLDAFCGDGIVGENVSKHLKKRGVSTKLTFIDKNPEVLDSIMKRGKKKSIDIRNSSLLGKYDLILARYGLHDLSPKEKEISIKSLVESLKKESIIILCDIMPSETYKAELTVHHQKKEDLCGSSNKNVCLATPEEYLKTLRDLGIDSKQIDYFYEEVYIRNWIGTLGVKDEIIRKYEKFTMNLSVQLKESFQVYDHPIWGVKIYYPVGTIVGVKNEKHISNCDECCESWNKKHFIETKRNRL